MASQKDFSVLFKSSEIQARVKALGQEISAAYSNKKGNELVVLGILKGSFIFLADLVRGIQTPLSIDFIEASSYGSGTTSSCEVKIRRDVAIPIQGRDVLLVEDIVDTGYTLSHITEHLKTHEPKSIRICSLLHKPSREVKKVAIDFLGFTIEDHFVLGYGLDLDNRFREIPDIVVYDEKKDV